MEFTIGEHQYRSSKMNAFQQFHVARKIAPLLARFGANVPSADTPLTDLLEPVIDALATMSEEDCNYVLQHCLAVVQRFQGGNIWAPVWNAPAKRLLFEDIDLSTMIQIAMQVLSDNLGNFIHAPSSTSSAPTSQGSDIPGNLSAFPMTKTG